MISAAEVSGLLTRQHDVNTITPAATISLDPNVAGIFILTPAGSETINMASVIPGQRLVLVVRTSGTSSYTLTFGTHIKSTGTLATGTADAKTFVIEFISDGTNYNEIARTAAM